jgi:hypothetical protein
MLWFLLPLKASVRLGSLECFATGRTAPISEVVHATLSLWLSARRFQNESRAD